MTKKMKRRDFMRTSAVAGLTLAAANEVTAFLTILKQSAVKPLVISSANGTVSKRRQRDRRAEGVHDDDRRFRRARRRHRGVNIVELDPLDDSVGYGGLPNAGRRSPARLVCVHGLEEARRGSWRA